MSREEPPERVVPPRPFGTHHALTRAVDRRKRVAQVAGGATVLLIFFGWMFGFGKVTDWLERRHGWDIADNLPLGLLLGYGVAIALAIVAGYWIRRLTFGREWRRCLMEPACFHCGQSLRGLAPREGALRCPECGGRSPVG